MKLVSVLLMTVIVSGLSPALAKTKKPAAKKTPVTAETKPETPPAPAEPEIIPPETQSAPIPPPAPVVKPDPAPIAAPATEPVVETPQSTSSGSHLFGLHAAVGLPHPLSAGLNYVHSSKIFSVEANVGSYKMTVDDVDAKLSNMEVGVRWHPFMGSFFLGALFGNHTIDAEKTEVINGQSITAKAQVKSSYLSPHFGWMWGMASSGFFMSMDFGVMNPSGATATFESNADAAIQATSDYQKLETDVVDQGEKLGKQSLPMWTMLKLGWLF